MKNILRKQTKFQTFLETLTFIFHLFFGTFPETPKPAFAMPVNRERVKLRFAVAAFELKKRGGVR